MKDKTKTVLIAGGSGLVGQRLTSILIDAGCQVHILTRSSSLKTTRSNVRYFNWDVANGTIDPNALEADVIVNLAGAGIADKRWTTARKTEILESRTLSTKLLRDTLVNSKKRMSHYIGASAIGIYGSSSKHRLTEDAISSSSDFMVDVCKQWEESHLSLAESVDKLSILRIGIVLSTKGGALKEIIKPLSLGRMGTYFGDGSMIYSWIHIDDLCNMFVDLMSNTIDPGIYNAVAPLPVSNKDLVKQIIDVKDIKAVQIPAPTFMMKLMLGEMANTILNSTSVSSQLIQKAGFKFTYPQLKSALENILTTHK